MDRTVPSIVFDLVIWQSNAKELQIATIPFDLNGAIEAIKLDGLIDAAVFEDGSIDLDTMVATNISGVVQDPNEGPYSIHNRIFYDVGGLGSMVAVNPHAGMTIFREDTQKSYIWSEQSEDWIERTDDYFNKSTYDTHFSLEAQSAVDSNISKCIYNYLLTRSDFASASSDEV